MSSETKKRVLILDDEVAFCETLKMRLQTFGYSVQTASTAREAWQTLLASPPDILLLDIRMPEEDGFTFMRRVRSYRNANDSELEAKVRQLPIIVVTGVGEGMKSLFEQEHVTAYITKPIDSTVLKKLIEENT